MKIYDYNKEHPFNLEERHINKYGEDKLFLFDAPYHPEVEESKKIRVYFFKSKSVPCCNLIFLHGIRNGNIPYLSWFARWFSKRGVNVFYLILPYHEERARKGWKGGEPFFHSSPAHCVVKFHEAVKDVRRTIDLIDTIEEFKNYPTHIMGYSFGGIISTMALALDARLKKGVLSYTGGDWHWINWHSPYTEVVRKMYREIGNEYGCRSEKDCIKFRGDSMKVVDSFSSIDDIFDKSPIGCFHYDPISYAKFISQPILAFRGMFDKIIPLRSTSELLSLIKNKKVVWLPSGHKSSYYFRRIIAEISLNFLKER